MKPESAYIPCIKEPVWVFQEGLFIIWTNGGEEQAWLKSDMGNCNISVTGTFILRDKSNISNA